MKKTPDFYNFCPERMVFFFFFTLRSDVTLHLHFHLHFEFLTVRTGKRKNFVVHSTAADFHVFFCSCSVGRNRGKITEFVISFYIFPFHETKFPFFL